MLGSTLSLNSWHLKHSKLVSQSRDSQCVSFACLFYFKNLILSVLTWGMGFYRCLSIAHLSASFVKANIHVHASHGAFK